MGDGLARHPGADLFPKQKDQEQLSLDDFSIDENLGTRIWGEIEKEIETYWPNKPNEPKRRDDRLVSSEWLKDFIDDSDQAQKPCLSPGPLCPCPPAEEESPIDPMTLQILSSIDTTDYTSEDVLFGRGGLGNNHSGNKRYRLEAAKLKSQYSNIHTTKRQKTELRNQLVEIVHGYGGRFLQYDQSGGIWVEVPLQRARKKASQALREGSSKETIPNEGVGD